MPASDSPQVDPALLDLFQAEMDTHIPVLNEGLLALEKGQAGAREIEAMMRAAHSIKGAARIVGIDSAVRVSHAMEDCFTTAKEGRIKLSSEAVDVLLLGVDVLQRICSPSSGSPVTQTALDDLAGRLEALKSGIAPSASPSIPASEREPGGPLSATIEPAEPTVALPATFDPVSCESLRQELLRSLARGSNRIKLDFAQVGELGASGLALLVSFASEAGQMQPAPAVESRRMSPDVRAVLHIAGVDSAFGIGR